MSLYPPGALFCRRCGYCLHGLPENRCPECGNGFNPADPATFRRSPRPIWPRRMLLASVGVLLVLALAYGGLLTWLYLGWRDEAAARAMPLSYIDKCTTRSILPAAISRLLPGDCRQWQERVDVVEVPSRSLSPAEIRAVAACRRLRRFFCENTAPTADDLAALGNCAEMEELLLVARRLHPGDLARLSRFGHLKVLWLYGGTSPLDDADLAAIGRLTELKVLHLGSSAITDADLAHLAGLTKLENLSLRCPKLTEGAVPYLARLTWLRRLNLPNGQLISIAADKLRAALPQCQIELVDQSL